MGVFLSLEQWKVEVAGYRGRCCAFRQTPVSKMGLREIEVGSSRTGRYRSPAAASTDSHACFGIHAAGLYRLAGDGINIGSGFIADSDRSIGADVHAALQTGLIP